MPTTPPEDTVLVEGLEELEGAERRQGLAGEEGRSINSDQGGAHYVSDSEKATVQHTKQMAALGSQAGSEGPGSSTGQLWGEAELVRA